MEQNNNNQQTPQISVVVPVYNVKKYLDKCVDSICRQTFQDLEILLVDDGSTDGSGQMCDQWAQKDARIQVIHKENGGLSDARNKGIDVARGNYIGFVDSDDYISETMYQVLYDNITKEDADLSICGMYHCYKDRITTRKEMPYTVCDGTTAMGLMLEGRSVPVNVFNRLYKREIFDQLRFPLGKVCEDVFMIVPFTQASKKVVVDTTPQYYYAHRAGTLSTGTYNKKDMDCVEGYIQCLDWVKNNCPQLLDRAYFRYYWSHFYVLDKMLMCNADLHSEACQEDYKRVVSVLRKNYMDIMKNPYVGRNRKIALTALQIHVNLYKPFVVKHREKNKRI